MTAAASSSTVALSELQRPQVPREMRLPAVSPGFGDLASFELLQRAGKLMSASPLVPDIYRGADGFPSCVIALNMALRMQADPLMVMQNLDVIHGRPSWRSTFLIACFNQCGRFTAIRYRWQGTEGKDDWGCRAWATEIATKQEVVGPLVTITLAKAEKWYDRGGSKWKTIPELMLMYRAGAWMIRAYAPELSMGLQTREEVEDVITLTADQYSTAQVAAGAHAGPQESTQARASDAPATETPPQATEVAGAAAQAKDNGFTASYAEVATAIAKAKTPEDIDKAKALVLGVGDERQRAELDTEERAKRKAISAAMDQAAS